MSLSAPSANPPARPPLVDAFRRIVSGLYVLVHGEIQPSLGPPRIARAVGLLVLARIQMLRERFYDLVARAEAGTLRPVQKRGPRARIDAPGPKKPRGRDPLPRAAGWLATLCRMREMTPGIPLSDPAMGMAVLLRDAAVQALAASDARIAQVLRSLWRMTRTDRLPACIALPPRVRKAGAPRAKRVRPPSLLPRGVSRADVRRSRAIAEAKPPAPPQAAPVYGAAPYATPPPLGMMVDFTPTHLTLGRRSSVFDPLPARLRWRG